MIKGNSCPPPSKNHGYRLKIGQNNLLRVALKKVLFVKAKDTFYVQKENTSWRKKSGNSNMKIKQMSDPCSILVCIV